MDSLLYNLMNFHTQNTHKVPNAGSSMKLVFVVAVLVEVWQIATVVAPAVTWHRQGQWIAIADKFALQSDQFSLVVGIYQD